MKLENSKIELRSGKRLPDYNRVYVLGEAKSGDIPSGNATAAQQCRIFRSAGCRWTKHKNATDMTAKRVKCSEKFFEKHFGWLLRNEIRLFTPDKQNTASLSGRL